MATYKVLQDIESEDKIIGWLSLRQFAYAAIVIIMGFIAFQFSKIALWLVIPFLPPMLFFGLLASPIGREQPTEVWLLARIRFFLKPRKRIWNQSGISQLVTITAPKKIERARFDPITQNEVRSRLHALASTIDSRGWAIKNVSSGIFANQFGVQSDNSDRLIDLATLPQEVPFEDFSDNDILDETHNPQAQHLTELITASEHAHHQQLVSMMQQGSVQQTPTQSTSQATTQPTDDYWFLNDTQKAVQNTPQGYATFGADQFITPEAAQTPSMQTTPVTADETALLQHIHEEQARPNPMNSRLKTILPVEEQRKQQLAEARKRAEEAQKSAMTATPDPGILNLANNDDLDVATIARQAERQKVSLPEDGEVIISLH